MHKEKISGMVVGKYGLRGQKGMKVRRMDGEALSGRDGRMICSEYR